MINSTEHEPAEVFHLSEFLCEEILARGWTTEDVAVRMNTSRDSVRDLLMIDLLICVHDDKLLLDDETCDGLGRAFGVSSQFFRNLDETWRKFPDRRSPFTPPETVFGPTSRAFFPEAQA